MPNLMSVLAVGFGGWAGWRGAEREPPRSLPVVDMADDMVDDGEEQRRREEEGEDCEVEGLELGRAVDACWACGVCAQFGSRAGVALLADRHRW